MTKTAPELTMAQSIRTYAAISDRVTIQISATEARHIARALEALEADYAEHSRIAKHNIDLFDDARGDLITRWSVIMLCAAAASQIARMLEVLL